MEASNWITANHSNGKKRESKLDLFACRSGKQGAAQWDDYFQIRVLDTKSKQFVLVTMTKEEALNFQKELSNQLEKFNI